MYSVCLFERERSSEYWQTAYSGHFASQVHLSVVRIRGPQAITVSICITNTITRRF